MFNPEIEDRHARPVLHEVCIEVVSFGKVLLTELSKQMTLLTWNHQSFSSLTGSSMTVKQASGDDLTASILCPSSALWKYMLHTHPATAAAGSVA